MAGILQACPGILTAAEKAWLVYPELQGVARTLLVPLACRARESARPDGLMRDPRAMDLFTHFEGGLDSLRGMSDFDQVVTVMRARQFDRYARAFLSANAQGAVIDIGCGLDTRFDRLDLRFGLERKR